MPCEVRVLGAFFLPRETPGLDAGTPLRCRFDSAEVVATFVSEGVVACVPPPPSWEDPAAPNPTAALAVSNNGQDWSAPLTFTFEHYCGGLLA
jgi:hypothetical protein